MTTPTKPRAADVARWVATLRIGEPSRFNRRDFLQWRRDQKSARSALRSWGLDDYGQAPLTADDYAYAASVEAEVLAQRAPLTAAPARPDMPTTRDAILLHLRAGIAPVPLAATATVNRLWGEGLVHYQEGAATLTEAGHVVADRLAYPEPAGSWGDDLASAPGVEVSK